MTSSNSFPTGTGAVIVMGLQNRDGKSHLIISYEGEEFSRQISSSYKTRRVHRTTCRAIKQLLPLVRQRACLTHRKTIQYVWTDASEVFHTLELYDFLSFDCDIEIYN